MQEDKKLLRIFFTMMLCFAIGSIIMCIDLTSVPTSQEYRLERNQPNMGVHEKYRVAYEQKTRFWEWNLGNNYVSASEHAVMLLSLFFGFMRSIDLFKRFHELRKERAVAWFFNLCDGNIDDNNF